MFKENSTETTQTIFSSTHNPSDISNLCLWQSHADYEVHSLPFICNLLFKIGKEAWVSYNQRLDIFLTYDSVSKCFFWMKNTKYINYESLFWKYSHGAIWSKNWY